MKTNEMQMFRYENLQFNTFKRFGKRVGCFILWKEVEEKEKEGVKIFNFRESSRGNHYDFKWREVIHN